MNRKRGEEDSEDAASKGELMPHLRKPTEVEFAAAKRQADFGQYERRGTPSAPQWALWQLHGRLVSHAKLYESPDLQDKRDAVAASILAVHDYLTDRGFAFAAMAPLLRPVAALAERENNSLDLLFAERSRGGRPKSSLADHERSGVLAALAEHWLATHETDERKQNEKLKDAARQMKGPWFGKVSAANLKTARDLVMQEGRDHPAVIEAAQFSETIAGVEQRFGKTASFAVLREMLNAAEPMHSAATKIAKTPHVSLRDDSGR